MSPSTRPLRALLVEDNPDDALLLQLALENAGFRLDASVVDTREAYLEHLGPDLDVVLSDHELPQFDAIEALDLLLDAKLDVPFIIVSGSISEEVAVRAMRRGAADYLLKDRTARLGEAVRRALKDRELARERERVRKRLVRIRQAVDGTSEAIVVTASNGQHLHHNPAAEDLFGFSRADFQTVPGLAGLFADAVLGAAIHDSLAAGASWSGEAAIQRPSGELVPVFVRADVARDGEEVVGHIGTFTDITHRKRYEEGLIAAKEAAEQAAQLKVALLTNMSHEIRTPLTAILGFAELLLDVGDGETQEFVKHIYSGGTRLRETLNGLMDLAQLESKSVDVRLETVDLQSAAKAALEACRDGILKSGLSSQVAGEANVLGRGDRLLLDRVLGHLLSNAIKFTREGGITLTTYNEGEHACLAVSDTGIGIAQTFVDRLFEDFSQESDGISRDYEGTGIGLSIVKRMVELMEGEVRVSSEKGFGSTFTVCLPRAAAA